MKEEFDYKIITKDTEELYLIKMLENAALIHHRKKDSLEWLKWKYFESPFGESICVVALTKDNEIAGEVTFGQYQYMLNGKPIKCLISYQTMVHPNHQKKGLFSNLTKQVLQLAASKNIELVLNFPNKASYAPFEKLNFVPINHIENNVFLVKKITTLLNILALKKPFLATAIHEISEKQLLLFNELKTTITLLKIKDTLMPNRTPEFIKTIKHKIIAKLKPNIILCNVSNNHPAASFIKKSGFYNLPHNISFFTFAINNQLANLLKKESWMVTATEFHRY